MARQAAAAVTAAAAILHFLTAVREARLHRIIRYMETQWGTPRGTTRNTLSKLTIAGQIERVGYGRYRIRDRVDVEGTCRGIGIGDDALEQIAPD